MKDLTRFSLEIIRIVIFICIGLVVLSFIENTIWEWMGVDGRSVHLTLPTIANIIFLFVIYRNFLQANGWFPSKNNHPLGKRISVILVLIASILLISVTFVAKSNHPMISQNEVINKYDRISNLDRLHSFIDRYQKNLVDHIRIVSYSLEGAPIYHDVTYNGKQIELVIDTSEDPWSGDGLLKASCTGIKKEKHNIGIGLILYKLTDCKSQTGEHGTFEILGYTQYRHILNSLQSTIWNLERMSYVVKGDIPEADPIQSDYK